VSGAGLALMDHHREREVGERRRMVVVGVRQRGESELSVIQPALLQRAYDGRVLHPRTRIHKEAGRTPHQQAVREGGHARDGLLAPPARILDESLGRAMLRRHVDAPALDAERRHRLAMPAQLLVGPRAAGGCEGGSGGPGAGCDDSSRPPESDPSREHGVPPKDASDPSPGRKEPRSRERERRRVRPKRRASSAAKAAPTAVLSTGMRPLPMDPL